MQIDLIRRRCWHARTQTLRRAWQRREKLIREPRKHCRIGKCCREGRTTNLLHAFF
jgi:hypothetical protein